MPDREMREKLLFEQMKLDDPNLTWDTVFFFPTPDDQRKAAGLLALIDDSDQRPLARILRMAVKRAAMPFNWIVQVRDLEEPGE